MSAAHGEGLDELYEALKPLMPSQAAEEESGGDRGGRKPIPRDRPLRLAIIGQPNAGKSTLINALLDEERMLTGPEAGITRDAIAIDWTLAGPADQAVGYGRASGASRG